MKINGEDFKGTVNFMEAKEKIFQDGLKLDLKLIGGIQMGFYRCPIVTFKLKEPINLQQKIKNPNFSFTRSYHSKGKLVTDLISCKVVGINPNSYLMHYLLLRLDHNKLHCNKKKKHDVISPMQGVEQPLYFMRRDAFKYKALITYR